LSKKLGDFEIKGKSHFTPNREIKYIFSYLYSMYIVYQPIIKI